MTDASQNKTPYVTILWLASLLTACGAQSVDISDSGTDGAGQSDADGVVDADEDADADGTTRSDADEVVDASEDADAEEEGELPICDDSVVVSPYCDTEGFRCAREGGGCCECVDTHGCGLHWDCIRLDPTPACPAALPVDEAPCPEDGLYCSYCANGSPRRFYCGRSGTWDFRALEVDCP